MALTLAFDGLMRQRAKHDPVFRDTLLREGIVITPAGTIDAGKAATK